MVDESTERRGQLSVNAIYNNKVAVLVGDYLLATALVQVGKTHNYAIIDVVSRLGQNLSEGELLQLSNVSNLQFSEEIYFDVNRRNLRASSVNISVFASKLRMIYSTIMIVRR